MPFSGTQRSFPCIRCDAPIDCGPHKTLYNRWKRWSENGVFARILVGLASEEPEEKTAMIDATYLKAHRTATSLAVKKGGRGRLIGRTKGGMNTKLHAVTDSVGRRGSLARGGARLGALTAHFCLELPQIGHLLHRGGGDPIRNQGGASGVNASAPGLWTAVCGTSS